MLKNYLSNLKKTYQIFYKQNQKPLNLYNIKKYNFCNQNPLENINYDDPQLQQLVKAIESGDKKTLDKILKGLDQALQYQTMIDNKDFDIYAKALTETDVYRIIQSVVELPEDTLIQKIKNGDDDIQEYFTQNIKKRIRKIPNDQAIKIIKQMYLQDKEEYHPIWRVWKNEFQRRLQMMSMSDIANLVNIFSHANKHTREFFRDIENELMEREWEYVPIDCISKLLKGFSYSNLGSSMIYNKISKSIKLAQHEINPLNLAEYAYMYSRASENMKAGFGVYHVAEKKIGEYLYRYNIKELTKLSKYFMGQNIGTNAFLTQMEEEIFKKYPLHIEPSTLVKLVKHTSKYFFQFKDRALFFKMESDCMKYLEHMSTEQISEVVWSYGRGRTGSYVLYNLMEEEVIKRIKLFSNRQLAFIYHSFCVSGRGSNIFFEELEQEILQRDLETFNSHLTVKLINGLNIRNAFDSILFAPIIKKLEQIDENSQDYKYTEIIQFLFMLIQTPPLYLEKLQESQEQNLLFKKYESLFQKFQPIIEKSLDISRIDQLCQTYIAYGQANTGTPEFYSKVLDQIKSAYDVPKTVFSQYLFTLCQHLELDLAQQFLPIIQDLRDYGNIKYFFSHDDFIKLTWSCGLLSQMIHEEDQQGYKTKNKFDIQFWEKTYTSLMEINPNTLKFHTVPIYIQNLMLMLVKMKQSDKFKGKQNEFNVVMQNTFQKINQLTPGYKQEISQRDLSNLTNFDTKHEIFNTLNDRVENYFKEKKVKYQLIQNFVDELMNTIDIALFIQQDKDSLQKIAIVLLNENHYKLKERKAESGDNFDESLLLSIQAKFSLMQDILDWNLIMVDEQQWNNFSESQKQQFFYDQIQLEDIQEEKTQQQQQQKQQKRRAPKKSFKDRKQKLQDKN